MKIQDLDHLRSNSMIRFKVEEVDGVPVEIVSYMIGDKELWNDPAALETRGNVYSTKTDECICACFPKFFNVGEREDTQSDLVKDQFVECFEKRDGSMITPVLIHGDIYWKTKKSFYSEVALFAANMVPRNVERLAWGCQTVGYTPIFEFTHPDNRIVLDYINEPNFTLIAIRSNETGEFLPWDQVMNIARNLEVPTVKKYDKTWDEIMDDIENNQKIEGYVLVLKDGRRVKIKTKWYLEMHRTMTDLRERDVVEAILNETVDDMKSLITSQGKDLAPIEALEKQVAEEIASIREQVKQIVEVTSDMTVKDLAIDKKGHPFFSLIMSEKRGKDANYSDFWKRNRLQDFSLRCIYNKNF